MVFVSYFYASTNCSLASPLCVLTEPLCPSLVAIDMWSAGVILLCILSGRYPFFRAQDDLTALSQIVGLLGTEVCARAAKHMGKSHVLNKRVWV